jgi:hypothetical protein
MLRDREFDATPLKILSSLAIRPSQQRSSQAQGLLIMSTAQSASKGACRKDAIVRG